MWCGLWNLFVFCLFALGFVFVFSFALPSFSAAAAKSLQSCPTLCDPIDNSPPGSSVPGILQARTRERVAISLSNAWKWKVKVKLLSRVRLLATPGTAAYQAPPSMGFSRQEYWSAWHCLLQLYTWALTIGRCAKPLHIGIVSLWDHIFLFSCLDWLDA